MPAYDGIELRRSATIAGLAQAEPVMVWRRPESGLTCGLIWAPEIHFIDGRWVRLLCRLPHPRYHQRPGPPPDVCDHGRRRATRWRARWSDPIQIDTGLDTFCLDATTFTHRGERYYLWAQQEPGIRGNSNLYIAPMRSPTELAGEPRRLSVPEHEWEGRGYWVNEGPAVVKHGRRLFITYSASATDANYAMGLLWADQLKPTCSTRRAGPSRPIRSSPAAPG